MKKILLYTIPALVIGFLLGYIPRYTSAYKSGVSAGIATEKNKKQYKEWYFMANAEQDSLYTAEEYIRELESRIDSAEIYMNQHCDRIDVADFLVLRSILIKHSTLSREETRVGGYREYDCNRDLDTLVDGIYYKCKKKISSN